MNDEHTYAAEMTAEEAIQMVLKRPEMYGLQKVSAVPDAATERVTENSVRHVKRLTTELQNKRESLNDQRREFRNLLTKARAERDAALARIAEAAKLHRPTLPGFGPKSCVHDGRAWPCPTVAALDGAPEPEWEWEYGAKVYNSGRVVRIEDSPEKVRLGMSAISHVNPQWVDDVLVRRRKAGPWLRAEGDSK